MTSLKEGASFHESLLGFKMHELTKLTFLEQTLDLQTSERLI